MTSVVIRIENDYETLIGELVGFDAPRIAQAMYRASEGKNGDTRLYVYWTHASEVQKASYFLGNEADPFKRILSTEDIR